MSPTGVPRKLICVPGLAVLLSGAGETSTVVPSSAALWPSVAGRHAGEAPLGATAVCAPERLPVLRTTATTTHASSRDQQHDDAVAFHDRGRPLATIARTLTIPRA